MFINPAETYFSMYSVEISVLSYVKKLIQYFYIIIFSECSKTLT